MYRYIVREPFGGFAKGEMLSQSQFEAYAAKGGHVDHHTIRIRVADEPASAKDGPAQSETAPATAV
jgi:hypothetical protein